MADLPIVCTLTPEALTARREGLLARLVRRAERQQVLPDGYRLRFAPAEGVLADIARVLDAERQCCQFLRFTLTVEPGGGPIQLELTGPPGSREFLSALVES